MLKATITAFAVLSASAALAQGCAPTEDAQRYLRDQFGEHPGPAKRCGQGGAFVCEEWSNPSTGTWTWVFYPGNGTMCSLIDGIALDKPA